MKAGGLFVELDCAFATADGGRVGKEHGATSFEPLRSQALLAALTRGGSPNFGGTALASLNARDRGDALARLQSEWAVTAEVVLENKDIGFVRTGQDATISFEAFTLHPLRHGTGLGAKHDGRRSTGREARRELPGDARAQSVGHVT